MSTGSISRGGGRSRRAVLGTVGAGLAGLTLLGSRARAGRPDAPAQLAQGGDLIYRGQVATVVLAGDGATTTQQQYQGDAVAVLSAPKSGGGLAETNPFGLFVGPGNPNTSGQPGVWEIHSAAVAEGALFQYWDLQVLDDRQFEGRLTDPHNPEALTWNLINVELPLIPGRPNLGTLPTPKGMGAGTSVAGTATQDALSLQLQGATIDGFTQFNAAVEAARAQA